MQFECTECHKILNLPDDKVPVGRPFSFSCPYCKQKNTAIIPADSPPEEEGWPPEAPPEDQAPAEPAAGPDGPAFDQAAPPEPAPPQEPPAEPEAPPIPPVGKAPAYNANSHPSRRASDLHPRRRASDFNSDDQSLQSLMMVANDDRPKALLVHDDEQVSEMLAQKLEYIGYSTSVAVNLRDAAKQLKFANFSVLLIQENYYGATLSSNHLLKTVQTLDSLTRRNMLVALISPDMTTLDDLLAFSLSFDAVINASELASIDRLLLSITARAKKFYVIYREVLAEHGLD